MFLPVLLLWGGSIAGLIGAFLTLSLETTKENEAKIKPGTSAVAGTDESLLNRHLTNDEMLEILLTDKGFQMETHIKEYLEYRMIFNLLKKQVDRCKRDGIEMFKFETYNDFEKFIDTLEKSEKIFGKRRYPHSIRHLIKKNDLLVTQIAAKSSARVFKTIFCTCRNNSASSSSSSTVCSTVRINSCGSSGGSSSSSGNYRLDSLYTLESGVDEFFRNCFTIIPTMARRLDTLKVNNEDLIGFYFSVHQNCQNARNRVFLQKTVVLSDIAVQHFPLDTSMYNLLFRFYPEFETHPGYSNFELYGEKLLIELIKSFTAKGVKCPQNMSRTDMARTFLKSASVIIYGPFSIFNMFSDGSFRPILAGGFYDILFRGGYGVMYISNFAVVENFYKQGYGTRLIREFFLIAIDMVKRGNKICYIDVDVDHNNPGAVQFFKKMGFIRLNYYRYAESCDRFTIPLRAMFGMCHCKQPNCIERMNERTFSKE